jgi:hypothetical protein
MMPGGSSSQKQRPTAQELSAARVAAQKDQRYEQAFRPLEQAAIRELDTANQGSREALLAGRSSADIAQQMGFSAPITGTGRSTGASSARARAGAEATATGRSDAATAAQGSVDADTLNVVRTGQNVGRQAQSGFTASARLANSRALTKLRNDSVVDRARGQAYGDVVAAGVGGHFAARSDAKAKNTDGGFVVPREDLSLYQRTLFRPKN